MLLLFQVILVAFSVRYVAIWAQALPLPFRSVRVYPVNDAYASGPVLSMLYHVAC
jgi:hypothetical protein